MNKDKAIVVLNNLIEINNDRIQVYETATIVTEESDLKNLFSEFQKTSKIFKSELVKEVQKMGGVAIDVIKQNSFFVKLWINFKASLINKDREDILNTLEYKEFVAIKSYKETLADNFDHLTAELLIIVKSQQILLTAHHDKVKKLADLMLS
ncbi:PA2169 family four-helix-bundle protein [Flavobacterium sp. LB2P84]|uniref:PA2169 family four-helix-bundle protein n=1 Tax=Flavobacterium yafengii TaxID=3041253 RepID=UPI0024A8923B|nr:PA2169 family four-helix-bundle protein [Flavobacterium yafengii]MDI6033466.1 PA2169 family four-helix-bundle protein [Flavobacterium yafengii]